jgi:hypothetical protein
MPNLTDNSILMPAEKFGYFLFLMVILIQMSVSGAGENLNPSNNRISPASSKYLIQQYEGKALSQNLENFRKEKLKCFKTQGINSGSFFNCCGDNYFLFSNDLIDLYHEILNDLEKTLSSSIGSACEYETKPCDGLITRITPIIPTSNNAYNSLKSMIDEIKTESGVNTELLEISLSQFQKNYLIFLQSRAMLTSYLFDTVHDIQRFIQKTQIKTNFPYEKLNPKDFLNAIGIINADEFEKLLKEEEDKNNQKLFESMEQNETEQSSNLSELIADVTESETEQVSLPNTSGRTKVAKSFRFNSKKRFSPIDSPLANTIEAIEQEVDSITNPLIEPENYTTRIKKPLSNFNRGLLTEVPALNSLNVILAKGLIDRNKVDLTKLPSEVLNGIKTKKLSIDSN